MTFNHFLMNHVEDSALNTIIDLVKPSDDIVFNNNMIASKFFQGANDQNKIFGFHQSNSMDSDDLKAVEPIENRKKYYDHIFNPQTGEITFYKTDNSNDNLMINVKPKKRYFESLKKYAKYGNNEKYLSYDKELKNLYDDDSDINIVYSTISKEGRIYIAEDGEKLCFALSTDRNVKSITDFLESHLV